MQSSGDGNLCTVLWFILCETTLLLSETTLLLRETTPILCETTLIPCGSALIFCKGTLIVGEDTLISCETTLMLCEEDVEFNSTSPFSGTRTLAFIFTHLLVFLSVFRASRRHFVA